MTNKTTPEFRAHAEKLVYLNHYLKTNPSFFEREEIQKLQKFMWYRQLSYIEMGLYVVFLLLGRTP